MKKITCKLGPHAGLSKVFFDGVEQEGIVGIEISQNMIDQTPLVTVSYLSKDVEVEVVEAHAKKRLLSAKEAFEGAGDEKD